MHRVNLRCFGLARTACLSLLSSQGTTLLCPESYAQCTECHSSTETTSNVSANGRQEYGAPGGI